MQEVIIKFYFLTICVLHAGSLIKGESTLEIFKSVGGDVTKVTSNVIELPSGLNVTLICEVVTVKNGKATKTPVRWFKMPSNSKFSSKVTTDFKNPASLLKLEKLNLEDAGDYACVSLKYSFVKDINLIVTNGDIDKSSKLINSNKPHLKKFKRGIYPVNRTTYDDFDLDLYRQDNLPSFKDTLDESRRYIDLFQLEQERNEKERRKQDEILSYSNNYYDTHHRSYKYVFPWGILVLVVGIIVIIVIIIIGITFYCRHRSRNIHNSNLPRPAVRSQPVNAYTNHSNNRNRYENRLLNPTPVGYNQGAPSAPMCEFQADVPITSLINSGTRHGDVNLPPNYNKSGHNSNHNLHEPADGLSTRVLGAVDCNRGTLPPSYAEALASDGHMGKGHTKDHGSSNHNYSGSHGYGGNDHNHSSTHGHDHSSFSHDAGGHSCSGGGGGHSGGDSGGGGGDTGGGGGDTGGGGSFD